MSYRHTIQAGLETLQEIEQLLDEFHKKDNIPEVEIDLVLQKTRNFYDIMLMLRQHQQSLMSGQPEKPGPSHAMAAAGKQAEARPTDEPQVKVDEKASSHSISADVESPEPASSPDDKQEEPATAPAEKSLGRGKEAAILSERFSGRSSLYDSIHETVSQRDGGPLGQVKPVNNIRSAIGVNDRFTYIRELFNNDAALFDSTVGILDDSANFNEAYNYMIQRFDWDMDSDLVQQLLDIIRRKHITGKHE